MKIASIDPGDGPSLGLLDDDGSIIDLCHLGDDFPRGMRQLLELGPEALAEVQTRSAGITERLDPATVAFLPLVPDPHALWCAALNYNTHIDEGNWQRPSWPPFFLRVGASLCGHLAPMVLPTVSDRLDYEGELAIVIGQRARHVAEEDAYDVIAGYACFNDGSVRDWQRHTTQITSGKNFAQTGPFGPWLTTKDEVPDIESSELSTLLNGKIMQQAKIGEMIFGIPKLINYLSTMVELMPGDVVVTGTPGGVGIRHDPPVFLGQGDVIEVVIEGVGRLTNPIVLEED
ncbi:MAG: fumarylacetoacetate hydrolase family protein [Marmoricola sp.]|nr:fumarylacetoacetate hydrolase family protein [Marmoricola sp.]MCW2855318.1 fumarylacetoacetate hydrolase family protein [Marmoricola sp.]